MGDKAEQAIQSLAGQSQAEGYYFLDKEFEVRKTALQQACHDDRGGVDFQYTLERAEAYYKFLKNG